MINLSTLDKLNREGFGANTDRLRLYLIEVRNGLEFKCPVEQYDRFNRLKNLLKEVDPNQEILEYTVDTTESDLPRGQDLLKQKETLKNIGQEIDIVAHIRSDGVQVTIEYENGTYKQAYTFINYQLVDLTDKLRDVVSKQVNGWESEENITISGRVTIPRKYLSVIQRQGFRNLNHAIVHFVSQEDYSEVKKYIRFIADDIEFQNEANNSLSAWETLSLLKLKGFEVPQRIKAQGIIEQNLEQAVDKMVNYFDNFDKTNEFEYVYTGVQFLQNSRYIKNTYSLAWCVNTRESDIKEVHRGKIKKLEWNPCDNIFLATAYIDEIDRDGRTTSKEVQYSGISLRELDRNQLTLGKSVSIQILQDNTKVFCDEYGKELFRQHTD